MVHHTCQCTDAGRVAVSSRASGRGVGHRARGTAECSAHAYIARGRAGYKADKPHCTPLGMSDAHIGFYKAGNRERSSPRTSPCNSVSRSAELHTGQHTEYVRFRSCTGNISQCTCGHSPTERYTFSNTGFSPDCSQPPALRGMARLFYDHSLNPQ